LKKGHLALEGGFSDTLTHSQKGTRAQGQPGQVLLNKSVRARLAYGIFDWMELGLEFDFALPGGSSLTSDLTVDEVGNTVLGRGGPHFRITLPTEPVSGGFTSEINLTSMSYTWQERLTGGSYYLPPESSWSAETHNTMLYVYFRLAVFLEVKPLPWLSGQLGIIMQNHPEFTGQRSVECDYYNKCKDSGAGAVDTTEFKLFGTPFITLSVEVVDNLHLTGQVFVHALNDGKLAEASLLGGDLALRYAFDVHGGD